MYQEPVCAGSVLRSYAMKSAPEIDLSFADDDADTLAEVASTMPANEMQSLDLITERERQVMKLVFEGASDAEIAVRLGITVRTTRDRLSRAFKKLGVRNRKHLMAARAGWASSSGLSHLPPDPLGASTLSPNSNVTLQ